MAKRKLKKKAKITIEVSSLVILVVILIIIGYQALNYYTIDSEKLIPIDQKKRLLQYI